MNDVLTGALVGPELLVLSERGIRFGVVGTYGFINERPTFIEAVETARMRLDPSRRAFVAIVIKAAIVNGIGDGTDRELVRFEVFRDRIVLVPVGQGGLSDEQAAAAKAIAPRRYL